MNLLLPDSGLLFWMTIIFAIVFFILAKFGFPTITNMVDKRSEKIDKALKGAKEADEKLSALTKEHEAMIAKTKAECSTLMQEAAAERESMIQQAKAEAAEQADRIIAQARVRIEQEKEAALKDIRQEVAKLSVVIAETLVRKELSSDTSQVELADRLFDEVRSADLKS